MRRIDNEERRARLALRHRLVAPAATVEEAARAVVGLHSSDPATVYLSARARVPGMKQGDLDAALYDRRSLVRILAMRRTMFVIPIDLAPILHHSSTVALMAPERKRLVAMVEKAGIASDGDGWVRSVSERTLSALRVRGEAVATELSRDVPELAEKITFYKKDGSVLTRVGMSTRVLFLLAAEGKVIRGRPKGSWVSSLYRWAPTDHWIGSPIEEMSRDEAQAALLRLWLGAFGPGTELDMKWWTGWPVTQVRAALAATGAIEVEIESGPAYLLGDDLEPVAPVPSWAALLPSLDPTTMGWKERDWYLGPHYDRLFDSNGNAGPTVWVDGRIVGGWGQRPSGEIVWDLLEDVGSEAAEEIGRQAVELQRWLDDRVVTARFRSPSDRALAAD
ncbi:MAG TPA: winged helix DNA-binding domain-containing protein [Acidimicrobiia bacterium]|nr:winged helix DNA-binding domain-containing protein [Acidimicrobiia bacterium]